MQRLSSPLLVLARTLGLLLAACGEPGVGGVPDFSAVLSPRAYAYRVRPRRCTLLERNPQCQVELLLGLSNARY